MTSAEPVRLIIKIGADDSMPEPPSIFYAEQRRVKQKLSTLKSEKQQLQQQLSIKEEHSADLLQCPERLEEAKFQIRLFEQKQLEVANALSQSQQTETRLQDQLQESLRSSQALRQSLTEAQQACDSASTDAATLRVQLQDAATESNSISQQLASQQQSADLLQQKSDQLQSQLQQSQDRVDVLEKQVHNLQQTQTDEQQSELVSPRSQLQHQLKTVEADRDALQVQVSTLQEALTKAQRMSTPPSPSGLTPPSVSRTPSPIKDESAMRGLKAVRAVLSDHLAELQQADDSNAVNGQTMQQLEAAQSHVQELEDQIMAWQASTISHSCCF